MKHKKPELLAPAGNLEKMKTAFAFGADAVYVGIPDFSLRVRINDFTMAGIKQAVKYAHERGKKIYVTINIFAHNKHIAKLPAHVKKLKEMNVDGIFISDPGVLQIVKKEWLKANIILSTQANCANWKQVEFWQKQGVSRVILSRELSIKEIAEIHKKVPKLELECFVHGALCMAYSGRCFLSKFFSDRDANLGDCIQPCRWSYKVKSPKSKVQSDEDYFIIPENRDEALELVEEEHGSYILNSKDLCLIKRLDELVKAGISAFKIEGRAKSVYYIANVVGAYAKAIDNLTPQPPLLISRGGEAKQQRRGKINFLYKELEEKLYHRGYTEGFMFGDGKMAQSLNESHKKCRWEFCGQVISTKISHKVVSFPRGRQKHENTKTKFFVQIKVHNSIKIGDQVEIIMPFYDIIKMRVKKIEDSKTGEELKEAHGGQGMVVVVESSVNIPKCSIARRKIV